MIHIRLEQKETTLGARIQRNTYFLGEINGISGLFCKIWGDEIVHLGQEALSFPEEVSVLKYQPVRILGIERNVRTLDTSTIAVRDIPAGTTFAGTQGTHTGIFLKCKNGKLILLDESRKQDQRILVWGTYCKDNLVSNYEVVDLLITCEVCE